VVRIGQHLGNHHRVDFEIEEVDGAAVVTEVHISKRGDEPHPVTQQMLRRIKTGPEALAPLIRELNSLAGGTWRDVREAHPTWKDVAEAHATWGDLKRATQPRPPLSGERYAVPRNRGRNARSDLFLSNIVRMQLEEIANGNPSPNAGVARRLDPPDAYTAASVKEFLKSATKRGLRESPPKGYAGGSLTRKAQALLADADKAHGS
jgi:hypothetical protein